MKQYFPRWPGYVIEDIAVNGWAGCPAIQSYFARDAFSKAGDPVRYEEEFKVGGGFVSFSILI